jgi:molecular chaperone HtpG
MAKHEFQTEVTQLMDLMIHSLYSNKEIFLRELLSNASDALDKLNYLTITDDAYKGLEYEPKIDIVLDEKEKMLTITDTGIGMNEEDLITNLGTIAKSGTKAFVQQLSGDKKKDSQLIGQFGVGFYSAFMVADKIEVTSKKAGEEKAYRWVSSAGGSYDLEETEKELHGTEIKLHLKDTEEEFLQEYRIESIVKKYSNHVPFKIYLQKEDKNEQINDGTALWRVSKSELKKDDYIEFYKQLGHDDSEPLLHIHTKAEGNLEYNTLFYIPSKAPFDLFKVDYEPGVKLYVKRVFITDDDKELLPTYLRFVKGIIDAEDLPLNVSREILQQNGVLQLIKKASTKKILGELKKMKEKKAEKYLEFWQPFGKVLKEGLYQNFETKEELLELMMYKSSKRDGLISLDAYIEAMGEEQKEIYYITGEDEMMLKNSPLLEKFKKKDLEVLILDEDIDAIVTPMIFEYKEKKLVSVTQAELEEEEEDKEKLEKEQETFKGITEKMKEALGDEVKEVKVTHRLSESPACIVFDKNDPDFAMQEMLKQMGQTDIPAPKPILEINPEHTILKSLLESKDEQMIEDASHLLLEQSRISEGAKVENPADFSKRLNRLLEKAL